MRLKSNDVSKQKRTTNTEHFWGTVNSYDPHAAFSLNWHIGLPAESASLVGVTFTAIKDDKTRVELTHSNWEAFGDKAADMRAGYEGGPNAVQPRYVFRYSKAG